MLTKLTTTPVAAASYGYKFMHAYMHDGQKVARLGRAHKSLAGILAGTT